MVYSFLLSGVQIVSILPLKTHKFTQIPINKNTITDSKKLDKNPYDFALYGGEDFELVFTINKKSFKKLDKLKNRVKFAVVGKILPKKEGIYLLDKGKKMKLRHGYEHFM